MRNSGSALIVVAILVMLIGALSAAFQVLSITYLRSSTSATDHQLAVLAAQSGAAYYVLQLEADGDYFFANPPPHTAEPMGAASFELEGAVPVGGGWKLTVVGKHRDATYRLGSSLGTATVQIPKGLVVGAADANTSAVNLTMTSDSLMASYYPEYGAFDPLTAGQVNKIGINGSAIVDASEIDGDVSMTGTLSDVDALITGIVNENAPAEPIADIDPYVIGFFEASKTANDNGALAGIFGSMWTDENPASQNYGDLMVNDGGTYIIPAGRYRFRQFQVINGSTVIFQTSTGNAEVAYVGLGQGTGTGNDLTLHSGTVKVDPGGSTAHTFMTALGANADFKILNASSYGQAIGDENNAGYTQIISMGGNGSSDDIMASGGSTVYGRVYAAAHTFTIEGGSTWYGSALAAEAIFNDGTLAVDLGSLGSTLQSQWGSGGAQLLAYWDE